jgi:hypothetical protein
MVFTDFDDQRWFNHSPLDLVSKRFPELPGVMPSWSAGLSAWVERLANVIGGAGSPFGAQERPRLTP